MNLSSVIFFNSKKFNEHRYLKEDALEATIIKNSKLLFGNSTIFINAKKKIEAKSIGGTIPDGFLFDLTDIDNPEFYLVEIELSKHSFHEHIFPQITKFFAFFKNQKSRSELIEKIFSIITNNENIEKEFKSFLYKRELYKFVKDTIENSNNILLILDNNKKELPEIIETYTDTWDKIVQVFIFKEYRRDKQIIFTLSPDFEKLKSSKELIESSEEEFFDVEKYTEEYHLEGVDNSIKDIYQSLKRDILKFKPSLVFNPQKYYISIADKKNFAYIRIRRKKLNIIVALNDITARRIVKSYQIKPLSKSVQKFYGRKCCSVIISNYSKSSEIIKLLKQAIIEAS